MSTPTASAPRSRGAGSRRALTGERIVAVALQIADQDGLDAVSMRRVASELGVGTMTLYTHVRDKEALLALMLDALTAEHLLTDTDMDWRTGLTMIARRSRESLLRHPWALSLGLRPGLGPNGLRHVEQSLAVASGLTTDPIAQKTIVNVVDDLVLGCTARELASRTGGAQVPCLPRDLRDQVNADPHLHMLLHSGAFPHLQRLFASNMPFATERFELALSWLLDGIERSYRPPTQPPPPCV